MRNLHTYCPEWKEAVKFRLYKVKLNGAYIAGSNRYVGMNCPTSILFRLEGETSEEQVEIEFRASSREEAKKYVRSAFPNAKFFC
jgi:hypothetical protein